MTIYRDRTRPMPTPAELLLLESMVDRCGLSHVVESLGAIATEKEAHVQEAWGDRSLARSWGKVGVLLDQFSDGAACRRVSI